MKPILRLTLLLFYLVCNFVPYQSSAQIIPPIIIIKTFYCITDTVYGTQSNRYINGVSLGTINNQATGSYPGRSYNNYTKYSTIIYKDSVYNLEITGCTNYSLMHYSAWIDYNNDKDFLDTGEKLGEVIATGANQKMTISFTVPANGITGTTRLRVMGVYNVTNQGPCASYTYGEVEDYTVKIENANMFRRLSTGMVNSRASAVRWVDVDKDNDLDISVSGNEKNMFSFSPKGKIYFNYGIDSVHFKSNIPVLADGDMKWCDFDRDADMDLLYAGANNKVLGNIEGCAGIILLDSIGVGDTCYFKKLDGFIGVSGASVDWGDYDNDGDYDAIISGFNNITNKPETYIYTNNNNSFELSDKNLPGIYNGKVAFIDFDLDNDLDVFMTGDDINLNTFTALYTNVGGNFIRSKINFENLSSSDFDWGDINNDGFPDLLLVGNNGLNSVLHIYINHNGKYFEKSPIALPGVSGNGAMCDFDNDGDLDILISGSRLSSDTIRQHPIFLNNGNGQFYPSAFTMEDYIGGTFDIGDFDRDNDADFVINGYRVIIMEQIAVRTSLFKNEITVRNLRPSTPTGLESIVKGRNVILSWVSAADNTTPTKALTYNIYIGTSKGKTDFVSPNADISSGLRSISGNGYIRDTSWVLKNLEPGKYYWSVQSIDNSYASSAFAVEDSFEILPRYTQHETIISSPYNSLLYFDCDHDQDLDACNIVNYLLNGVSHSKIYVIENKKADFLNVTDTINLNMRDFSDLETIAPNDYNSDNKIDIAVSGVDYSNEDTLSYLYRFNNNYNYSLVNISNIPKLTYGYQLWCDLDNDGWQDIIMSGKTVNLGVNNKPVAYIFKNMKNGTFARQKHNISGITNGKAVIGDFDNDMDADIIVYGSDSLQTANTYLYLNKGNYNFEKKLLPGLKFSRHYVTFNMMSGDFNKDGFTDILVQAIDSFNNNYTRLYINDSLDFEDQNLPLRSQSNMSAYFADYDFDGDLDMFVYLIDHNDAMHLYINNNGILDEITYDLSGYTYQLNPFMAADLNNRNGLDFIINSFSSNKIIQFIDNWGLSDRLSVAPAIKGFQQNKFEITLQWEKLDNPAFTYNIWVGTSKKNVSIVSPMADLQTGYRYIQQPGNAFQNSSWKLKGLSIGKYYWSVQAVDLAYNGGPWAQVDSFEITSIDPEFTSNTTCLGKINRFNDMSVATASISNWKWDFGDGTYSNVQNPYHKYSYPDTFNVSLSVYSNVGDSASIIHQVIVKPGPNAAFRVSPVCLGSVSGFENLSDTSLVSVSSWVWDYGNGESSTTRGNVNQTYIKSDTAILTIEASNGCADADTQVVYIGLYPDIALYKEQTDKNILCAGDSAKIFIDPYIPGYKYIWQHDTLPVYNPDQYYMYARYAGKYIVTASDPFAGCSKSSNIINFSSPPRPVLYVNNGPNIYYLVCSNTTADIYKWYCNGELIPQAQKYYYLAGNKLGTYYVETQDIGSDCSMRSPDITIPKEKSGDLKSVALVYVYPNPSNGSFKITFNEPNLLIHKIEVVALTGETIYSSKVEKVLNDYNVQLPRPNPGIYLLKVGLDKQDVLRMLVVQ